MHTRNVAAFTADLETVRAVGVTTLGGCMEASLLYVQATGTSPLDLTFTQPDIMHASLVCEVQIGVRHEGISHGITGERVHLGPQPQLFFLGRERHECAYQH